MHINPDSKNLDKLSSCTMVKLGKTYGNLMANVRPINSKLKRRAVDIIMYAAGCTEKEAMDAFEKAGGNAREAILLLLDNAVSPEGESNKFCNEKSERL